jgi:hypothetical protein
MLAPRPLLDLQAMEVCDQSNTEQTVAPWFGTLNDTLPPDAPKFCPVIVIMSLELVVIIEGRMLLITGGL